MLVNEFLRQSTDAKLDSRGQFDPTLRTNVHFYRAEARFLRALSYWHGIDLFGNIPLVTEDDPLGATPPKQATRAEIYAYAVSRSEEHTSELQSPYDLVCRLLLEKKKKNNKYSIILNT